MSGSARSTLGPALLGLGLIVLLSLDCTSWRATKTAPEKLVADKPQITMRVISAGAPPVILRRISISGDTLYGYTDHRPTGLHAEGSEGAFRVSIPHEAIQKVEIRRTDAVKTTLLVVGISITVTAILTAIAFALDDDDPEPVTTTGGSGVMSCPIILCLEDGVWHIDSGTYAGAIMPALARRDVDNLEHAHDRNGLVRVRLTGLTGETEHVDALALLSVDHDPNASVAPEVHGTVVALGALAPPSRAVGLDGRDALPRVAERDEWCWESALDTREIALESDLHDGLEIEFPRKRGATTARLVVDGANTPWAMMLMRDVVAMHGRDTQAWYDEVAADSSRVRRIRETMARETFLHVRVWARDRWEYQGSLPVVGPECLKRQVVELDLSRVEGSAVRVRLECVPNLWMVDCVSMDFSSVSPIRVVTCPPERARDRRGADLRAQLVSEDSLEYVIAPGDTAEVTFRVPPRQPGRARSYVAQTTGWYRIHAPQVGEPQMALLDRLESEPGAVARFAVKRMNGVVVELARERD